MTTKTAKTRKTSTTKRYPKICAKLRAKHVDAGPLDSVECKQLIGWTEQPPEEDWGKEFVFKDVFGKKIRLGNNPSNRPFKRPLANRYANEHLRKKWSLNLETIVLDENGNVLQGQHRLVGFILGEQLRQIDPKQWGATPLQFEVLLGFGVSPKPENANTYDLGAKRNLGDVLYRHQKFGKDVSDKEQKRIATILAGAVRLVWIRSGGNQVSFAPHFPHSEAIEFYRGHPEILQAVEQVIALDDGDEGGERCISSLISLSYAASLLYLMADAQESWEQADKFWELFASGEDLKKGNPILSLRQLLVRMDASSGTKRDEIIGTVIKAWNLWKSHKPGTTKEIKVKKKRDGDKFIMAEFPRIGGLDSTVESENRLTQHQQVLLSVLKRSKKEITYDALKEGTGLQIGQISNAVIAETKQGKKNPLSLESRKLVKVNQYASDNGNGDSPYMFQLTATGRKSLA